MTAQNPLLSISKITYTYPDTTIPAVDNVSFSLEHNEYLAVLGANGSGKSTLARLICGYLGPDSGKIDFNAEITGIVFQQPKDQIIGGIVSDDTAFGPENIKCTESETEMRVVECLGVTDLLDRINVPTCSLSLGQTQKLAFAGILALHPELLVLDEAVSMVDPASRSAILHFLDLWHKNGHAVIHVTHDLDEALKADRIIVFDRGKILFDGTKAVFESRKELVFSIFGEPLSTLDKGVSGKTASDKKETVLSIDSLSYSHINGDAGLQKISNLFVSNLSLSFQKGSFVALMGETGSGKSTLLELLAGLLEPLAGEVRCDSRPVLALQECEGALFEQFASDEVAFGARNKGVNGKALVERVKSSMDCVALPYSEFADRQTFTLSGGEKRKLLLASIIALDADIVLFDEPTAGLDPVSRRQVINTLSGLCASGKTIVFSTHRKDEAEIADRVITLKNGAVLSDTAVSTDTVVSAKTVANSINGDATSSNIAVDEINATASSSLSVLNRLPGAELLDSLKKNIMQFDVDKKTSSSVIGKLSPAKKYIAFFCVFAISLFMPTLSLSIGAAAVAVCYALLGRCNIAGMIKSFSRIIPWLCIFFLFQIVLTPVSQNDIVYIGLRFFSVTNAKLLFGTRMFFRTFSAFFSVSVFVHTISQREIIIGLRKLLHPLEFIHIPIRYAVIIVTIVFRFIPLLFDEASMIIKTQLIRGGLGKTKGFFNKIRSFLPLFVPLVLQTLRRAQSMSDALAARYFA